LTKRWGGINIYRKKSWYLDIWGNSNLQYHTTLGCAFLKVLRIVAVVKLHLLNNLTYLLILYYSFTAINYSISVLLWSVGSQQEVVWFLIFG